MDEILRRSMELVERENELLTRSMSLNAFMLREMRRQEEEGREHIALLQDSNLQLQQKILDHIEGAEQGPCSCDLQRENERLRLELAAKERALADAMRQVEAAQLYVAPIRAEMHMLQRLLEGGAEGEGGTGQEGQGQAQGQAQGQGGTPDPEREREETPAGPCLREG